MKYCAAEDLVQWADPNSYAESARTMAMEAAADFIHKRTGDQFYREAATAKLFGGEGKGLLLVTPSLHAITSVQLYDDYDGTLDETLSADEYEFGTGWLKRRNLTMRRNYFPVGKQNVKVTGDWGWDEVPPLIRLAAARLSAAVLMGHTPEQVASERLGNYAVSYRPEPDAATAQMSVTSILEMFRLHKVVGGRVRGRRAGYGNDICPRRWSFIGGE